MSITTRCQHCGAVDLVRNEHVSKAEHSYTQFYCGHCNRAWAEATGERRQAPEQQQATGDRRPVTRKDRRKV